MREGEGADLLQQVFYSSAEQEQAEHEQDVVESFGHYMVEPHAHVGGEVAEGARPQMVRGFAPPVRDGLRVGDGGGGSGLSRLSTTRVFGRNVRFPLYPLAAPLSDGLGVRVRGRSSGVLRRSLRSGSPWP